ncbi:MAG TPA: mandelate racemase/muconate lactonizing enzyme family protein [Stellaceae bacterium]|nr:mandelate racemase/muconate lactonizing enzyme family protein [Stellaceae bacterium]
MKIVKIEDFHADGGWRTLSYLKISTDEGIVGWAEFNEGFGVGGASDIIRRFAPMLVGQDPRPVGRIGATLRALTQLAPGGLNNQAIAAIENACLDIKAKALGVPVCALFGGPFRERIPLYWSHCGSFRVTHAALFEKELGTPPIRSLHDVRALGQEAAKRGFKALKTNPLLFDGGKPRMAPAGFQPNTPVLDKNIDSKLIFAITDQLAAFRDGAGPEMGLLIDLNFSQHIEGYRRIAKAIEPFDMTWVEIDLHDAPGLAAIRRSTATPVASLETIYGIKQFRPFFEEQAVDVAIVDVPWNGLWESVRVASLADAFGVNCAPHNFYGDLASLISAHFCASIPNFRIMEFEADDMPWIHDFVTEKVVVENGELVLPKGPGWGADVNEEALKAHPAKRR